MKKHAITLDDIVFEHRNKEYGCYDLRYRYQRRLRFSFLLVLTIFISITTSIYFWKINPIVQKYKYLDNSLYDTIPYHPDLMMEIIQLPENQLTKPTPPKLVEEPDISKQLLRKEVSMEPEVPRAKYKPVLPVPDTSLNKLADNLLRRHKNNIENGKCSSKDSIMMVLEKVPQFPGGGAAIQSYLYNNQQYPISALSKGIQGRTIVSFIVNEAGIIENAKIVSGIYPEIDLEALRLVSAMPRWQPAYYKGKPISCKLIMPIDFAIR